MTLILTTEAPPGAALVAANNGAGAPPPPPPTLDDLQAPPPDDGTEAVLLRLPAFMAEYLRQRAAAHRQTPAEHAAMILRQFRQTDTWRLQRTGTAPGGPGEAAGTRLAR